MADKDSEEYWLTSQSRLGIPTRDSSRTAVFSSSLT